MKTKNTSEINPVPADDFYPLSITPIELIGYSKNDIVDAQELIPMLPTEYRRKLKQAYILLDEVQEYLYNN